jgi:hypothetical protein
MKDHEKPSLGAFIAGALVLNPKARVYRLKNAVAVTIPKVAVVNSNPNDYTLKRMEDYVTATTKVSGGPMSDPNAMRYYWARPLSCFRKHGRRHAFGKLTIASFYWSHEARTTALLKPDQNLAPVFENKGADSLLKAIGVS